MTEQQRTVCSTTLRAIDRWVRGRNRAGIWDTAALTTSAWEFGNEVQRTDDVVRCLATPATSPFTDASPDDEFERFAKQVRAWNIRRRDLDELRGLESAGEARWDEIALAHFLEERLDALRRDVAEAAGLRRKDKKRAKRAARARARATFAAIALIWFTLERGHHEYACYLGPGAVPTPR